MGRAARLLGFDVDFAPCLDLATARSGRGRPRGPLLRLPRRGRRPRRDGLPARPRPRGPRSCVKHFPGLGRGAVDSHAALPVVDAHDVDLMVTDVAPFTKLARGADGVMVGHAAYPGFDGRRDRAGVPARRGSTRSCREPDRFDGVVYSDDLEMGALGGDAARARAGRAAARRLRRRDPVQDVRGVRGGGRPASAALGSRSRARRALRRPPPPRRGRPAPAIRPRKPGRSSRSEAAAFARTDGEAARAKRRGLRRDLLDGLERDVVVRVSARRPAPAQPRRRPRPLRRPRRPACRRASSCRAP